MRIAFAIGSTLAACLLPPLAMGQDAKSGISPAEASRQQVLSAPSDSPAVTIHVSTQGNDAWTGKSASAAGGDGPVRTLQRAQTLARAESAAVPTGKLRQPIRVLIQRGTYQLASPLVFTPADSGSVQAPVSYEAVTAGSVTLSGGALLVMHATKAASDPVNFGLPAGAEDTWQGGGQLYVNGVRATLARQPKSGSYWFVQRPLTLDSESANETGREAFGVSKEAATWLAKLSAAERSHAIVQVRHVWNSSQHRIAGVVGPADQLRVTPRTRWPFLSAGLSQRYFIENLPSALTAAGEWVATATAIQYRPTAAQAGRPLEAVLPLLERLVVIRGDGASGKWVEHLTFRGLQFAHTRYLTPREGFSDPQAALTVGAAIEADGARAISIENCDFSHLGGYGVWLRKSVRDSRISNSVFTDLGAGGIEIGTIRDLNDGAVPTSGNLIAQNQIGHTGQIFPGAVGVWIGQGFDNTVTQNLVHDTTYTGISVGWTWGFGPSASGNHRITNNLLVNIGRSQLSDMGGIYTLGTLTGTVISGNVIREVRAYPGYGPGRGLGAWGIYNDEGTTGVLVEDNIIVGTDSGAYHLHFGRNITVRNNLMAGGKQGEIRLTRTLESGPQATLDGNFIVSKAGQPIDGLGGTAELKMTGNRLSGEMSVERLDMTKCGNGCVAATATLKLGVEPKAIQFIGMDAASTARMTRIVMAAGPTDNAASQSPIVHSKVQIPVQLPSSALAPPIPVAIDLRRTSVGAQPKGMFFSAASNPQAVHVIEDASSPEGRCLQFNDGPNFVNRFDPHGFIKLNHETGTSTASFAILIDARTDFVHEWRDDSAPYRVGPSLRITPAGVFLAGKVVAPVTVGKWTRIKVTSALGTPGARWQLQVTDSGGNDIAVAQQSPGSMAWQALNYAGFISNTSEESRLCLGAIVITNTAIQ